MISIVPMNQRLLRYSWVAALVYLHLQLLATCNAHTKPDGQEIDNNSKMERLA